MTNICLARCLKNFFFMYKIIFKSKGTTAELTAFKVRKNAQSNINVDSDSNSNSNGNGNGNGNRR